MKKYFKNHFIQSLIDSSLIFIFDLNGLIVDDEIVQLEATNLALLNLGYTYIKLDKTLWKKQCVGRRADIFLHKILKSRKLHVAKDVIDKLVNLKNNFYKELIREKVKALIRPHVTELIFFIKNELKKPLALATSAMDDEAEAIIGHGGLGIKYIFDYILTGKDITYSKPDPEIYIKIERITQIRADKGLVFEDSQAGVIAAKKAEYRVICVPNEFTIDQDLSQATMVISGFERDARILSNQIQKNPSVSGL